MRRPLILRVLLSMLAVTACSGGTGSSAAPGESTAAPAESPGESAPMESASPAASEEASGGTGFDPMAVTGDLTLQGWSAGAVEAPILQQVLDEFQAKYPNIKV